MTKAANDNAAKSDTGAKRLRPCPICGKPSIAATQPFCSPRCADVDLHRWLGGGYTIASDADEAQSAHDADGV